MLSHVVRTVLPARLRPRFDTWLTDYRWRHGIRMEPSPELADRLWADGYRFAWRIHGPVAIGHTLDGRRVTMPVELFFSRYFGSGRSG
jgi:hypothetical protein